MTNVVQIGDVDGGSPLTLGVDALVGSHLCIQANSGAGKSGTIRKVLETTHGAIQHVVLDVEDEFYTLRERFDYLIAGGDNGDCAATPGNAADLARMILETGFSAILQINALGAAGRFEFIASFLNAMTSAPKSLWRPALVVMDEAQFYAPQKGNPVSLEAMRSFMLLGRKRGFTGLLATPRPADLNKEVTSPVNNWLIGRCGQPTDRRAAADALGFSANSPEARGLRSLVARQFWAFGPALTVEPVLAKIGRTDTTIVKAGQATIPTPPAPAAMRAILEKMNAAAKAAVASQETASSPPAAAVTDAKAVADADARGYARGYAGGFADGSREARTLAFDEAFMAATEALQALRDGGHAFVAVPAVASRDPAAAVVAEAPPPRPERVPRADDGSMPSVAAKIVDVIDLKPARAFSWKQIAMLAGYSEDGGQFRRGKKWLLENGVVVDAGAGRVKIAKPSGKAAAPTGDALVDFWKKKLPSVGSVILANIWSCRTTKQTRSVERIAAETNYAPSGGQFRRGMKALKDAAIIEADGSGVRFTAEFRELAGL